MKPENSPIENGHAVPAFRGRSEAVASEGLSPHEKLSAAVPSRLGWATVYSTIGCLLVLFVLTVWPYLNSLSAQRQDAIVKKAKDGEAKKEEEKPGKPNETSPKKPAADTSKTTDSKPADGKPSDKNVSTKDAAKKIGETDTKSGTPKDPVDLDKLIDR